MSRLFLLALLSGVAAESTPSSLLGPRHFNHHSYEQYLKEVEPTKQGPVLFPNDAPPPPRPPLIVTSRPLLESAARSELNNSVGAQSRLNQVYHGRNPQYDYEEQWWIVRCGPFMVTCALLIKRLWPRNQRDYYPYNLEEQQPTLPPIYRVIAEHANKNLRQQQKPIHNNYKIRNQEPGYARQYESNNVNDDDNNDYNQAQNYAFSYTVKDQKTGDDFSHSQHSSGSATNGEYRVRLPDGRMQIVSYTADENGYNADVRYDDEKAGNRNSIDYNVNRNLNNDYNTNHERSQDYKRNHERSQDHNANHEPSQDYVGNHERSLDYVGNHERSQDYVGNQRNYGTQNENYERNQNANYLHKNIDYNAQNYNADYKDNQVYNVQSVNVNDNNYGQIENTKPVTENHGSKEDYQYGDSKEYYGNDYSLEYDDKYNKYDPHKSKFTAFSGPKNPKFVPKKTYSTASTVIPSYEELKPLFIQKKPFKAPSNNEYLYSKIPIEISVPSSTPSPYFDATTERVVIIGTPKPNLYTNIRSSLAPIPVTPVPKYSSIVTTPRSFLASTIASFANLKKNIDFSGAKPRLTNTFIDKINRYLSYK